MAIITVKISKKIRIHSYSITTTKYAGQKEKICPNLFTPVVSTLARRLHAFQLLGLVYLVVTPASAEVK
ncbi:MAG: hypothetical protein KDD45_00410 [Bdellovibrionales bacterium]|nr:hypothetical protein [Bdellovibrionales bacterium]